MGVGVYFWSKYYYFFWFVIDNLQITIVLQFTFQIDFFFRTYLRSIRAAQPPTQPSTTATTTTGPTTTTRATTTPTSTTTTPGTTPTTTTDSLKTMVLSGPTVTSEVISVKSVRNGLKLPKRFDLFNQGGGRLREKDKYINIALKWPLNIFF